MKYTVKKIAGLIITLIDPGRSGEIDPRDGGDREQSPGSAGGDGTQPSPAAAIWTVGERLCDRRYGNLLFLSGAGKRLDRR